ncbi:MAG TPA: class A beta-lactamase [Pyrinomonadaceae bacterium]|nr:class A beta-lactamase [Pyrinomonadaceae bacterium]
MKKRAALALLLFVIYLPIKSAAQETKNLERAVARLARAAGGTLGVTAIHIETGRRVSFNGGERFPMASVYKFPIALRLLQRVERGEIHLEDTVKLGEFDFRIGYSPIAEMANNTPVTFTVGRLLELMLGESDNTASDALLRLAGGPAAVTARLRELGVTGIDVNRPEGQLIMDHRGVREYPPESQWTLAMFERLNQNITDAEREAAARRYAADPRDTSSPDAMAELLVKLHRREVLSSAPNLERVLRIMTETTTGPARLKGLLPAGTVVTHKTGSMGGTTNDVGLITLPDDAGHLAIAVFVKGSPKEQPDRERAIAEIARTIYDYFVSHPGVE